MTTWTREDEQRLRENELRLANLVIQESRLQEEITNMKLVKAAFETEQRKPLDKFIIDNWMFKPEQKTVLAVNKLSQWLCSNRAALVPLLNKIDEAMK